MCFYYRNSSDIHMTSDLWPKLLFCLFRTTFFLFYIKTVYMTLYFSRDANMNQNHPLKRWMWYLQERDWSSAGWEARWSSPPGLKRPTPCRAERLPWSDREVTRGLNLLLYKYTNSNDSTCNFQATLDTENNGDCEEHWGHESQKVCLNHIRRCKRSSQVSAKAMMR